MLKNQRKRPSKPFSFGLEYVKIKGIRAWIQRWGYNIQMGCRNSCLVELGGLGILSNWILASFLRKKDKLPSTHRVRRHLPIFLQKCSASRTVQNILSNWTRPKSCVKKINCLVFIEDFASFLFLLCFLRPKYLDSWTRAKSLVKKIDFLVCVAHCVNLCYHA